jgi:hypothetical protein
VPSDAEHHRRIETIHPGPRFQESSGRVGGGRGQASKATKL